MPKAISMDEEKWRAESDARTQEKWRAESDARTLAEHHEIMSDTRRRDAAIKAAGRLAEKKNMEAEMMQKAAGMKGKIAEAMKPKKDKEHEKLA